MADTSFENELNSVTNKLINVTIGEVIDMSGNDWEDVLLLIKEKKMKRQSCDIETLEKECTERYHMDPTSFNAAISKLVDMKCIKQILWRGKVTFSLLSPEVAPFESAPEVQISSNTDFTDFKKYVTDSLGSLNLKIEKYQSSLEIKDVVIKLLREELKSTQDTLKSVLAQHSEFLKRFSPTKTSSMPSEITQSYKRNELSEIIEDIPFDESLFINSNTYNDPLNDFANSNKSYNDPLNELSIKQQLSKIRTKNHNDFISKFSRTKNVIDKNQVDKKGSKADVSIVDGILLRKNKVKAQDTEAEKVKVDNSIKVSKNIDDQKSRNHVVICGDSLLNNIEGNGVSSKKVKSIVRNFPGADSEDMLDYIKPILAKKKPDYLILHVGTNDLTSGCDTNSNLEKIRKLIHELSPKTELVISKVIVRDDKPGISSRVENLNLVLESFAEKYNLFQISHGNITRKMLSKKKLHLNGNGISQFAQNLKNFVIKNC